MLFAGVHPHVSLVAAFLPLLPLALLVAAIVLGLWLNWTPRNQKPN